MKYKLIHKSDFSKGAMLVVSFPETDLDKKAVYTLEENFPNYLVPFRFVVVDGNVECTYFLDNLSKLVYFQTDRSPQEYVSFWKKLLSPLLDCSDWFLKETSFVLHLNYLYATKNLSSIQYIYVPTISDYSDRSDLEMMVSEVSRVNGVTDPKIENYALKAIIKDFRPAQFLTVLQQSISNDVCVPDGEEENHLQKKTLVEPLNTECQPVSFQYQPVCEKREVRLEEKNSLHVPGDIVIDLEQNNGEKKKGKFSLFGSSEKKQKKEKIEKSGLFQKKTTKKKEIVLGAAQKVEELPQEILEATPITPRPIPHYATEAENVTQIDEDILQQGFYYLGSGTMPSKIPVMLLEGQVFTIGRFDVSVGYQQCTFEFDKKTKAVSRRHAAVECRSGVYHIVDLGSAAGTYLNGEKIVPNIPYQLVAGMRVSFGTGGADYQWKE